MHHFAGRLASWVVCQEVIYLFKSVIGDYYHESSYVRRVLVLIILVFLSSYEGFCFCCTSLFFSLLFLDIARCPTGTRNVPTNVVSFIS